MITKAGIEVLEAFVQYRKNHFLGAILAPTIRDVAKLRNKSQATIQQHINKLTSDGYLRKIESDRRLPRNYELTELAKDVLSLIKETEK